MLSRRQLMNDKIVSAQGENLSLVNVKGSKLNALSVYGKSTQSGTPSPENPVPIVSAGDSGEINVAVSGKNLIPFPYLSPLGGAGTVYEADGVTYTVQADGGIKCVGTPTNKFGPSLCNIRFSDSQINAQSSSGTDGEITLSGGPLYYDSNNSKTFIYWALYLNTPVDMTIYPQVEYGTVATAYEPYKTPQTLTLSTPGGLPGIPVSSGGNYTDESGQQWICDEIDLERGKYVQRVGNIVLDGTESWETWGVNKYSRGITGFYHYFLNGIANPLTINCLSNLLPYNQNVWGGRQYGIQFNIGGSSPYIMCSVYNDSLSDISTDEAAVLSWKELISNTNLTIFFTFATPIENDLPAEEIAAYKALHTYSPTTTVSNDANAWMKVGYREWRR